MFDKVLHQPAFGDLQPAYFSEKSAHEAGSPPSGISNIILTLCRPPTAVSDRIEHKPLCKNIDPVQKLHKLVILDASWRLAVSLGFVMSYLRLILSGY